MYCRAIVLAAPTSIGLNRQCSWSRGFDAGFLGHDFSISRGPKKLRQTQSLAVNAHSKNE
jgi:hypothetical protein